MKEEACKNCVYFKEGRCEKHDIKTHPEALCKKYAEKEEE